MMINQRAKLLKCILIWTTLLGASSSSIGWYSSRRAPKIDLDHLLHNYAARKLKSSPIARLRHVYSCRKVAKHQRSESKDGGLNRIFFSSKNITRTRIMRQLPSPQLLHRIMFNSSNNAGCRSIQFNNKDAGMTKPLLDNIQYTSTVEEKPASSNESPSCLWWPQSTISNSKGWRVKTYRRRVGKGVECYNLVRNAALDWEFSDTTDGDSLCGIVRAIPPTSSSTTNGIPENTSCNVLQIWSSDSNGEVILRMRKLATFTKMSILSGLQKKLQGLPFPIPSMSMYVLNPTAVIYDFVDERAPRMLGRGRSFETGVGNTFTSTAYATLAGHLLCGEERVTVILRDEVEEDAFPMGKTASVRSANVPNRISSLNSNTGGFVDVEIVSYSKPAPSILGRLVWPFIGAKQDEFFRCEMDALARAAR